MVKDNGIEIVEALYTVISESASLRYDCSRQSVTPGARKTVARTIATVIAATVARTSTLIGCLDVSGWTRGVQVKLWDPLRTRAIPERLRRVFTTRRHTNPRLLLPYLAFSFTRMISVVVFIGSKLRSRICFHQKSTTLAYVLYTPYYVQINYVNPLLSLDAYFVFSDY